VIHERRSGKWKEESVESWLVKWLKKNRKIDRDDNNKVDIFLFVPTLTLREVNGGRRERPAKHIAAMG
jgi:hypothetical protein